MQSSISIIFAPDCISCCFESDYNMVVSKDTSDKLEVFYAQTKDLSSGYSNLQNYITNDEQIRADKFHLDEDRKTYISCHALLRLILSKKLNKDPLLISFVKNANNKPEITGNPIFFNITHTRDSFAIAISSHFRVGIDLEKVNPDIDFKSIIKTNFSKNEGKYILESNSDARNRFFLLWTRKEALLKAFGTGIITDLTQVEVSEHESFANKESLGKLVFDSAFNEHFIYSKILLNYYLSIALPHKAEIILNQINGENINSYLD